MAAHRPVDLFGVQVAEGVSLGNLVLPAVHRMTSGQQALVVLRLGHWRGRRADPLVGPAVVEVRQVRGRRGLEDQHLLAATDRHPGLLDLDGWLEPANLLGDLLQSGVGDVLADDPASRRHPVKHSPADAVEHGAEGLHARLQLARGLLQLQAVGLALGNRSSQRLQLHQSSVLIRVLSGAPAVTTDRMLRNGSP
jgi:hypothetical protein